jgi:hypothetical protein
MRTMWFLSRHDSRFPIAIRLTDQVKKARALPTIEPSTGSIWFEGVYCGTVQVPVSDIRDYPRYNLRRRTYAPHPTRAR